MQKNAEKCRDMQRNEEICRTMQRNVDIYHISQEHLVCLEANMHTQVGSTVENRAST